MVNAKMCIKSGEICGLHFENPNSNAKKVLLTVDLSVDVIQHAIKNKIGLIISRYGLIVNPIKSFSETLVKKAFLLSKSLISVYTLGEPFTTAENGICSTIINILFLNNTETLSISNEFGKNFPIGLICSPEQYPNQKKPFQLKNLVQRAEHNFEYAQILYIGGLENKIEKIAVAGTEYVNINTLIKLKKLSVDCLVSMGVLGQYESIFAKELNLCVISLSFYDCVKKALKKLTNILSLEFPREEFYLYNSKNPYNISSFENNVFINPELELKKNSKQV